MITSSRRYNLVKHKKHLEKVSRKETELDTKYKEYIHSLEPSEDYKKTSEQLKQLVKLNLLKYHELKGNPEKLFRFHKIISEKFGLESFGIKATVQYNLYAGSVLFLGNEKQVKELNESYVDGKLGCFALTEKNAGVISGLIVETNARLEKNGEYLRLSTPDIKLISNGACDFDNTGACKTWISQGQTADYMVVFANLIMDDGEDKGLHPFFIKLEDYNVERYVETDPNPPKMKDNTIYIRLMEGKSAFLGIDNSRIIFNNIKISKDTLLSKYCVIDDNKKYRTIGVEKFSFLLIVQRLLTGRAIIGMISVYFFQAILDLVKKNVLEARNIPFGKGRTLPLGELPHIRDFVKDLEHSILMFNIYINSVLKDLCYCLKNDKPIDDNLVERISICKIIATDFCVEKVFKLKTMIGSESLFLKNQLGVNLDIFYCCLFAEGDNRILQQKITRDHLYQLKKQKLSIPKMGIKFITNFILSSLIWLIFNPSNIYYERRRLEMIVENKLFILGNFLTKAGRDRNKKLKLWMHHYKRVYEIANLVAKIEMLKSLEKKI